MSLLASAPYRPRRIVLVRHGESEGNLDDTIYETVPDHALRMTELGRRQVLEAGVRLREELGEGSVRVWASPYVRSLETFDLLRLGVGREDIRIEPRIREQDWGNFQVRKDVAHEKELRDRYGHFFYRFIHGESGADVYDRVSSFLESLQRSFLDPEMEDNAVIITHGLMMRLFCMRWFHWSVEYFESLSNPGNAEYVVLQRQDDHRYRLTRPFSQWNSGVIPTDRERSSWL